MPIIQSAKKALRQSQKKQARNVVYKAGVKKTKKNIEKVLVTKDVAKAKTDLSAFYKIVDKAAKKNVIHKNKANRIKSRLALKIKNTK
jgi:small subunit ribosomal protein S20